MKQIAVIFFVISLIPSYMNAQSPYGWRGPTRNGIYPETGLLKTWPSEGPELLWETLDAGKGYSSPVIVNNHLYITGMNEDETMEIFSAYTLDGKKLYEVEYGKPWDKTYPETRTTPTIEGNKAYMVSGTGEIVCLNIENGAIVWKVNGGDVFEHKTGTWGTSECPLVFDNKMIYTPAGDQTTIVALNAETGETVWKSKPLGDIGAYVSPLLITYKGKRQIIGSTAKSVFGVNPETGDIDWTFREWAPPAREGGRGGDWPNIAPNSPLYKDGRIFFCHGYDIGAYMLQLNDDLSGVTLLWNNNDLDTHHGGYVLVNDIIYGSNWINNNQGNWVAVDWNSGETKYEEAWSGGKGKGSVVSADGMLYCYDERRGGVGLVRPTANKFDVVSEFRITKGEGPHWAHPVIVNGILYIRHGSALMAYKIK
ncbi:outer membrane protein assembly factor BamB [Parabacteroides sp. PF5-5]|uniref:PQQ-binding-like beta-propeller repeat protein n=1 Tax=unclassified Parabacteroides TaxID=2649774 RepID=UPI0024769980|nr:MULTISPECIES: PQQ-binding-like beta-propeller repeat protein [unclassified Parabacteroides]MDH6303723.1 outer membrane protein assembly factor BamB [Parabacteroides sp. PH5-39]MDH6314340.1 outer membrane protein assembly factor BamB [Parabacteroides sp. PF5-13]MDH6318596.1 outer membrane protein assembly factor BamB [Parabacteroides sp. PH5-13]MDH6322112.1 outer membrane protein assembly factor BamB [Parabacteroides sp. PH5-8]MDH6325809.1 outer membrane protein assembly factor BamB [Parabac